jgi:sugar lactone lactonase YvrE
MAALCDGWSVVRFTMEGQLERVIGLPVPCPTDVAFRHQGGVRELVVTTQRQSVPLDTLSTAPLSGQLLLVPI